MKGRYAYSIKTSRVKEPDFPYTGKQVTCTTDLLDFARSLQTSDIEKMLAVFLDAQNQIIGIHITSGTVNQAMVYPREIVRNAILSGAMRDHPDPQPPVRASEALGRGHPLDENGYGDRQVPRSDDPRPYHHRHGRAFLQFP